MSWLSGIGAEGNPLKGAVNRLIRDALLLHNPRGEQAACVPRDGREPIGEIAYAVCFRSLAYFSSSSKERYGVTPSTYRREPPGDA